MAEREIGRNSGRLKIFLYFIGKPRDKNANALTAEYLNRVSHYASVQTAEIRPAKFDLFARHPAARKVLLDPKGDELDSAAFAQLVATGERHGQDLLFLVGGAEGLPPAWRPRADLLLSLSAMTFPHELARAMLAEQIYRAFATLRGHPYPR